MNEESNTSFGVMWGDTTWRLAWEATLIWVTFYKASLIISSTALQTDKSIGRSTWSRYNNSKYADLSSLTYHQHYPTLETDKSISRSNVNA